MEKRKGNRKRACQLRQESHKRTERVISCRLFIGLKRYIKGLPYKNVFPPELNPLNRKYQPLFQYTKPAQSLFSGLAKENSLNRLVGDSLRRIKDLFSLYYGFSKWDYGEYIRRGEKLNRDYISGIYPKDPLFSGSFFWQKIS